MLIASPSTYVDCITEYVVLPPIEMESTSVDVHTNLITHKTRFWLQMLQIFIAEVGIRVFFFFVFFFNSHSTKPVSETLLHATHSFNLVISMQFINHIYTSHILFLCGLYEIISFSSFFPNTINNNQFFLNLFLFFHLKIYLYLITEHK